MQIPVSYCSMARPKLPDHEQKSMRLIVRLTPVEHARVRLAAEHFGILTSEFARRRLLGVRLPNPPSEDQLNAQAVAALNRIGVNLNQIAKRLNSGHATNLGRIINTLDGTWG